MWYTVYVRHANIDENLIIIINITEITQGLH